jgi:thiol-disulfide isomerase/thioredoxin
MVLVSFSGVLRDEDGGFMIFSSAETMVKQLYIAAAGGAALVLILAAIWLGPRDGLSAGPPLVGWMQNFTPTSVAGPAPRLSFLDRGGKTHSLADIKGRLVVVNFWATWCGPCIREMPSLVRLQKKLSPAGVVVLALSEDRKGWPVIEPFIKEHGLASLAVYHDDKGTSLRQLTVAGLPTTILFDGKGRELGRLAGIAEWDSAEAVALIKYYIASKESNK